MLITYGGERARGAQVQPSGIPMPNGVAVDVPDDIAANLLKTQPRCFRKATDADRAAAAEYQAAQDAVTDASAAFAADQSDKKAAEALSIAGKARDKVAADARKASDDAVKNPPKPKTAAKKGES